MRATLIAINAPWLAAARGAGHAFLDRRSMQSRFLLFIFTFILALVPLTGSAQSGQKSSVLTITVTVVAKAKLHTDYQATDLIISSEDVARGFVDVAAASLFSVTTNSRIGYCIDVHAISEIFDKVRISGLDEVVWVGPQGASITQRGTIAPETRHVLGFRFHLKSEIAAGHYAWPLMLAVHPLV